MPKRKSGQVEDAEPRPGSGGTLRRSLRQKPTASSPLPQDKSPVESIKTPKAATAKKVEKDAKGKVAKSSDKADEDAAETKAEPPSKKSRTSKESNAKAKGTGTESNANGASSAPSDAERHYWLMKAEPETRLENGVDVKFSIDDLAARTEPEPWDGIRNYVARNNLRAMKKGDLAFFYHSNCKEPGIVGTMEIVQENSPDLSAHDPKAPYYDPSSKPSDPKWSVVHVKFRSKFAVPIGLKELKSMGKPLENMQMLKQSRLSVSRVSASEWEYLIGVAEAKAKDAS